MKHGLDVDGLGLKLMEVWSEDGSVLREIIFTRHKCLTLNHLPLGKDDSMKPNLKFYQVNHKFLRLREMIKVSVIQPVLH